MCLTQNMDSHLTLRLPTEQRGHSLSAAVSPYPRYHVAGTAASDLLIYFIALSTCLLATYPLWEWSVR